MVNWTTSAKRDLKGIQDFISIDSLHYARKTVLKLIEKAEILNRFPLMGRMVPEIMDDSIREIIVDPYRIIYTTSTNQINILAVIHGKRDFNDAFDVS